ncbi:hypothetical protein GCM10027570_15270 [Streptomonospora sediminis]
MAARGQAATCSGADRTPAAAHITGRRRAQHRLGRRSRIFLATFGRPYKPTALHYRETPADSAGYRGSAGGPAGTQQVPSMPASAARSVAGSQSPYRSTTPT